MLIATILASAILSGQSPPPPGRHLGLFIGAGPYNEERTGFWPLHGGKDAQAVAAEFKAYVPDMQVSLLVEGKVTRSGIIREFQRLERTAGHGDIIVLFYSGHSVRIEPSFRSSGTLFHGTSVAWVPVDARLAGTRKCEPAKDSVIQPDDIQDCIRACDAKGVAQILIVTDAVYGGFPIPDTKSSQVVYIGPDIDQIAYEGPEGGNVSVSLRRALQEMRNFAMPTYRDLAARMATILAELPMVQVQTIIAEGDVDAPLMGPHSGPGELPLGYEAHRKKAEGKVLRPAWTISDPGMQLSIGDELQGAGNTFFLVYGRCTPDMQAADQGPLCLVRESGTVDPQIESVDVHLVGSAAGIRACLDLSLPHGEPASDDLANAFANDQAIDLRTRTSLLDDFTIDHPRDYRERVVRASRVNLMRNRDMSLLASADLDPQGRLSAPQVQDFVRSITEGAVWNWLDRLSNPGKNNIEVRLARVTVERSARGTERTVRLDPLRIDSGRPLTMERSDRVAIALRAQPNTGGSFVTVFDLMPDGKAHVLWPIHSELAVPDELRLPADGKWHYLGIDNFVDETSVAKIVPWLVDDHDGIGREVFKVLGTSTFIPLSSQLNGSSVTKALDPLLQTLPDGSRMLRYDDSWSTAQVSVTVPRQDIATCGPVLHLVTASTNPELPFASIRDAVQQHIFPNSLGDTVQMNARWATKERILGYLEDTARQTGPDDTLVFGFSGEVVTTMTGPALVPFLQDKAAKRLGGAEGERVIGNEEMIDGHELAAALSMIPAQHRILLMDLHGDEIAQYDLRMLLTDLSPNGSTGLLYVDLDQKAPKDKRVEFPQIVPVLEKLAAKTTGDVADDLNALCAQEGMVPIAFPAEPTFRFARPRANPAPEAGQIDVFGALHGPFVDFPSQQGRGGTNAPSEAATSIDWSPGKNYALLIASNKYDNLPKLTNPESDAKRLAAVLKDRYGFEVAPIMYDPSSGDVFAALDRYNNPAFAKITPKDQLFVFFAGHGAYKNLTHGGIGLICTPASLPLKQDPACSTYIPYGLLSSVLDGLPFGHVCLTLDVCFGGTFSESIPAIQMSDAPGLPDSGVEMYVARPWHMVLTSGDKAVPDAEFNRPGGSPFANALIDELNGHPSGAVFMGAIADELGLKVATGPKPAFFGRCARGGNFLMRYPASKKGNP